MACKHSTLAFNLIRNVPSTQLAIRIFLCPTATLKIRFWVILLGALPYQIAFMLVENDNDDGKKWIRTLISVKWYLDKQDFYGHLLLLLQPAPMTSYSCKYIIVFTVYSLPSYYFIRCFLKTNYTCFIINTTKKCYYEEMNVKVHSFHPSGSGRRAGGGARRPLPDRSCNVEPDMWLVIRTPDDYRTRWASGLTLLWTDSASHNLF